MVEAGPIRGKRDPASVGTPRWSRPPLSVNWRAVPSPSPADSIQMLFRISVADSPAPSRRGGKRDTSSIWRHRTLAVVGFRSETFLPVWCRPQGNNGAVHAVSGEVPLPSGCVYWAATAAYAMAINVSRMRPCVSSAVSSSCNSRIPISPLAGSTHANVPRWPAVVYERVGSRLNAS